MLRVVQNISMRDIPGVQEVQDIPDGRCFGNTQSQLSGEVVVGMSGRSDA